MVFFGKIYGKSRNEEEMFLKILLKKEGES